MAQCDAATALRRLGVLPSRRGGDGGCGCYADARSHTLGAVVRRRLGVCAELERASRPIACEERLCRIATTGQEVSAISLNLTDTCCGWVSAAHRYGSCGRVTWSKRQALETQTRAASAACQPMPVPERAAGGGGGSSARRRMGHTLRPPGYRTLLVCFLSSSKQNASAGQACDARTHVSAGPVTRDHG